MRILHVNKFLYRRGGAESYLFDVADLQRAVGHTVEFFGMQHRENETGLTYASHFPAEVQFDPPPADLSGRLRAAGRMLYSTSARRGIADLLDDFKPDVVHVHNIYHQLSPSVLGAVAHRGIPAVMTLHDAKLVCPTYLFLDKGELCEACVGGHFTQAIKRRCKDGSLAASTMAAVESTLHRATGSYAPVGRFICPSRFLAGKMQEAGVYPDRIRVLENFVETDARTNPSISEGPVAYAGRLSYEKGADVLIEAAGLIPDASFVIMGDGPQRAALEARAAEVAGDRVMFTGRVSKAEVTKRFAEAPMVVLPSRCHENQPMTVLEAFAVGTPVIGTNLGGIPELVEDGVRGLIVPHNDPRALATALRTLIADPERARGLGDEGRRFLGERFSPARHLRELDALYQEASAMHR